MKLYEHISLTKISYILPTKYENTIDYNIKYPDWNMESVIAKTGVQKRFIADEEETAVDLAEKVGAKFFKEYNISPDQIDSLIFVTQSPDYVLPTSACIIQDRLGLPNNILAFDLNLGCSGFVNALAVGISLIESSMLKNCLIICAETYNKYIEDDNRTTRSLFSDAAAICLVEKNLVTKCTVGPIKFGVDGSGADNLIVKGSGARELKLERKKSLFMDGSKVFMFTMREIPIFVNNLLEEADLSIDKIDLFIFHQASKLVLDTIMKKLGINKDKIFSNIDFIGNTVSCSIPIALYDAIKEKKIKKGMNIMLVGFGVGYSWGGMIIKWDDSL